MIGHRLDGGAGVLIIANVRANLFLPQRVNVSGDKCIILSSWHGVDQIIEMVHERNVERQRSNNHAVVLPQPRDEAVVVSSTSEVIDLTDSKSDVISISDTLSVISLDHDDDFANVSTIDDRGEIEMLPSTDGVLSTVSSECLDDFPCVFSAENRNEFDIPPLSIGIEEFNGVFSSNYDNISISGDSVPHDSIHSFDDHNDLDEILSDINKMVGLTGDEPFRFLDF